MPIYRLSIIFSIVSPTPRVTGLRGVMGVLKHVCTCFRSSDVHITIDLEVAPLLAMNNIKIDKFTISMMIHLKYFILS